MATTEELQEFYKQAKYREVIAEANIEEIKEFKEEAVGKFMPGKLDAEEKKALTRKLAENDKKLLKAAWAYHQLGEYDKSLRIFEKLRRAHLSSSEIGESSRRGMAHGLLQKGDIQEAYRIITEIPRTLERENAIMNLFIISARKGIKIPAQKVMEIAVQVVVFNLPPYTITMGHIVNNGALALYEARAQEDVKPHLMLTIPSMIEFAIAIYEAVDAPKNHIAGAFYRASLIFEAAGRIDKAKDFARRSADLWQEILKDQDGDRYLRNLAGALVQLKKLES